MIEYREPALQPVRDMTLADLRRELHELRVLKAWGGRYFEVDREVQRRATIEWVKEDVFGAMERF